jgi:hypothetical protein
VFFEPRVRQFENLAEAHPPRGVAMNRNGGAVLAALIVVSLLASGGSHSILYTGGEGKAERGAAETARAPETTSEGETKNENWTVPPDPRCFLIGAIREFYGSKNPAGPEISPSPLPAGPYNQAYHFNRYGCPEGIVDEKNRGKPQDTSAMSPRTWGVPPGEKAPIRFMIVTAPDPAHTHLSLFFDRTMDAVQQATQAAEYVFSRAAMPWNAAPQGASDLGDKLAWDSYQVGREKLPGLMIFRQIDLVHPHLLDNEDLFIFVVGETPTGGIHKAQFENALLIADDIRNVQGFRAAGDLAIMGPTFSGSLPSLNDLLTKDAGLICRFVKTPTCNLEIHSGTVTSYFWGSWFIAQSESTKKANLVGQPQPNFITFQESDTYSECHFFAYAARQGYELGQIAELSEDETAFGQQSQQRAGKECRLNRVEENSDIVRLHFPREISQLRTAYQTELQTPQNEGGKPAPRTTLPLNLQDSGNDDDTVPTYAHQQQPLSQESVMLTIATALRTHHSRFVLLKASDPIDLLFLTRFLRQAYPQGRIVTVSADLLYRREVEDDLLHGIMAITPYSLLPRADDRVARPLSLKDQPHFDPVFPSSWASGAYNAMLSLLPFRQDQRTAIACGTGGGRICISAKLGPRPYTEYGWPSIGGTIPHERCSLSPVLWLTVLGRDSYWPVAILDPEKPGCKTSDGPASSRLESVMGPSVEKGYANANNPDTPLSWILLVALVLLLGLFYLRAMHNGSVFSGFGSYAIFAPGRGGDRNVLVATVAILTLWSLAFLALPLLWRMVGELGARQTASGRDFGLGLVTLTVWVALAYLYFLQIRRRILPSGTTFGSLKQWPRLALAVAILASLWLGAFGWTWARSGAPTANMGAFRFIHATSGVSPLPACLLLLVAGLWWSWHSLEGLALRDSRDPTLPSEDDLGRIKPVREGRWRFYQITQEGNRRLRDLLDTFPAERYAVYYPIVALAACALMALLAGQDPRHPIWTLESWWFDWLYLVLLLAVTFLLVLELGRLTAGWIEFRLVLRALEALPLRRTFCYIDGFSWKRLWSIGGGSSHDSDRAFSREMTAWRYLVAWEKERNSFDWLEAQNAAIAQAIGDFPETLDAAYHKPEKSLETERNEKVLAKIAVLRQVLAKACAMVFNSLRETWDQESGPSLYDLDDPNEAAEDKVADTVRIREQFVALVYVNFIVTVVLRMRTMIVNVAGLYVCALLSLSSYPFEPKVVLRPALILAFFAIIAIIGWVYAQMHRDATLSRLTDTTPGELGADFYFKMGGFIILPLISLLVSQFPDISNFVFSWLQPAAQALNH